MNPKKELLWGLWVVLLINTYLLRPSYQRTCKPRFILNPNLKPTPNKSLTPKPIHPSKHPRPKTPKPPTTHECQACAPKKQHAPQTQILNQHRGHAFEILPMSTSKIATLYSLVDPGKLEHGLRTISARIPCA